MIHFDPPPEPEDFDKRVRRPGENWRTRHPDRTDFPNYWKEVTEPLADGFKNLCAYSCMHVPLTGGTVDHFRSRSRYPHLAYEWSNYRYASPTMNSYKSNREGILDPFEVVDGWFEIELASMQLVATSEIPPESRERAAYTLERLRLATGTKVVSVRRHYSERFISGGTLDALGQDVPLICRAVIRTLDELGDPPAEEEAAYRNFRVGLTTLWSLQQEAPEMGARVRASLPPSTPSPAELPPLP